MFTADTMASVARPWGCRFLDRRHLRRRPAARRVRRKSGEAVVDLLRKGITARQIMTKEAFENAIAVVMAFGGSTNAVLHLLAIAREAEVDLTIDDFTGSATRSRTSATSSRSAAS